MKHEKPIPASLVGAAIVLASTLALAQPQSPSPKPAPKQPAPAAQTAPPTRAPAVTKIVYTPPLRGAPAVRVGGGTRGPQGGRLVTLSVLAPDHTGLTVRDQPTLYWHVDRRVEQSVEVVLVDWDRIDPVLELALEPPVEPGVHTLDLREAGVKLALGTEYQWFVAIINDAEQRSKDVVAGGAILRVGPTPEQVGRGLSTDPADRLVGSARQGLWYDVLDEVSRNIARGEQDAALWQRQRGALLEQVGLGAAAAHDSAAGSL